MTLLPGPVLPREGTAKTDLGATCTIALCLSLAPDPRELLKAGEISKRKRKGLRKQEGDQKAKRRERAKLN